jgi:NADH:ubiquinone oxidoreductase subunit F (NADH-binding)
MCQTGGSSAGLVTAEALDAPLDFGSLAKLGGALGSGSMLVMDDSTCVVDFLKSVARFFEHESCGQCTPCREGAQWILEILTNISQGKGRLRDLPFLEKLAATMQDASFCPLGQSAPTALLSALKHFRPEIEAHIKTKTCPTGICRFNESGGASHRRLGTKES